MESILVVGGAGFMGSGIVQVCAQSGNLVHLFDNNSKATEKAFEKIRSSLERLNGKGLLTNSPQTILDRIVPVEDLNIAAKMTWVIETVPEIEKLKLEIFQELDNVVPPTIPLATNTSTIPVTRIALVTKHPERVLGLHFFGPANVSSLVEVIKGEKTSADVFEKGVVFAKSLGKTPVRVLRDIPGFVMNRIWTSAVKEAVNLISDGITTPNDIDIGMQLGFGWKKGLFEMVDGAGVDTVAFGIQSLRNLGEESLAPHSNLLENMVKDGRLGRKVGNGFYRYTEDGKRLQ